MQTSTKLKAVYAIHPPLRMDSDISSHLYHQFFNDFERQKTIPIRGSFACNGQLLAVTARACTISQKTRFFSKTPFLQVGDAVLEFTGLFEFPGEDRFFATDQKGAKVAQTTDRTISDWKDLLPHYLELTIQNYFCALSIAYQGAVRPIGNIWIVDGARYGVDRYYLSEIHESIEFLRENSAFPEIDVGINEVIKWTFAQNGIFDGYSDTPASRALNYFTRLFVSQFRNDELSDLIWALAGIEALLVENGRSSVGQLREKLGALFADKIDAAWLSKMIGDSYNFRSRMIHGDRQIRSFFRNDEEESKKRIDEEYNSQLFAIGMLVLLLRLVISKNLSELHFSTVFKY
ncbi:hypothetical protein V1283_003144 [Bradyrhizobium sp. AZCC 2262]|uniref:hypothetical protein n=1 Tax=Bradyrhizobium sp. AZCC 2262 TaxID=3117022 RepID=UPI002FF39C3D